MSAETWQRVRAEYEAGLEVSPETRAARLAALREAGESELADEVGALWTAERAAGGFLERATVVEPDPVVGTSIGPYRVLHRLGAGGMGAVYLAARADGEFRRRVALKLLKPGMDSEEIQRRFRFERQILAALDHPNIARLLDGGTTAEGRPYFVLEAVFGEPLDQWGRAHLLPERLRLFATICRTVQFAHQNLVVHRDLKPSNILVTADGAPKLVDFGIAKLLNPELGGPTLVATAPVQAPHTPDYASPEQLRGERVTTATDIYSLGLLLAELVTGERPRREAPGGPAGPLPAGDLGAIVAKALRPAPADRYPSAAALADDVERFLDGHPVRARKGTTTYRARLFVRRHKVGVAMAATALVALLTFGIAMAALATRLAAEREVAVRERQRAEDEKQLSDAVSRFLAELFQAADPHGDRQGVANPTVRDLLHVGAERARTELEDQPAVQARLLRIIGVSLLELGQHAEAEATLKEALVIARATFASDDIRLAAAQNNLAMFYDRTGQAAKAEPLYRESLEIRRRALGPDHLDVAASFNNLGVLYLGRGRYWDAVEALEESLRIRRLNANGPELGIAGGLGNLGAVLVELRRLPEAAASYREALAIVEAAGQQESLWYTDLTVNLGSVLVLEGRCSEALAPTEQALAIVRARAPRTVYEAETLQALGRVRNCVGEGDAARKLHEEALVLQRRLFGTEHPKVATSLQNLAEAALATGDLLQAEHQARAALALRRRILPPDHPDQFDALAVLAGILARRGDLPAARQCLEEALLGRQRSLGEAHPKTTEAREALAQLGDSG
ncbi:MAG: serine/threonine-protein kinase [Thermoanaerobaculia bacterium]|nr:serine/threonine-protein kinase [Thermoanaerobaculia bacterium]